MQTRSSLCKRKDLLFMSTLYFTFICPKSKNLLILFKKQFNPPFSLKAKIFAWKEEKIRVELWVKHYNMCIIGQNQSVKSDTCIWQNGQNGQNLNNQHITCDKSSYPAKFIAFLHISHRCMCTDRWFNNITGLKYFEIHIESLYPEYRHWSTIWHKMVSSILYQILDLKLKNVLLPITCGKPEVQYLNLPLWNNVLKQSFYRLYSSLIYLAMICVFLIVFICISNYYKCVGIKVIPKRLCVYKFIKIIMSLVHFKK